MKKGIRMLCILLAMLMFTPALAQTALPADAADRINALTGEEVRAIVEAMFTAAAGTTEAEELALWDGMNQRERETRSLENAAYRALTKPWLLEAFAPGNPPDLERMPQRVEVVLTATPTPAPTPTATPAPTPIPAVTPEPTATPEPAEPEWTLEDGYQALAANAAGQAYLALLEPLGGTDAETCMKVTQGVCQRWLAQIDHEELYATNDHYQCWLYAPATPIDYPVVQCRNNEYYLSRLFNRQSNPAGTLFIDYRNLTDFQDPNTLIYGHHMRDSTMFHSLTDYDAPGFFDAHPFMLIVEADEIYLVDVFAGYVTESSDHCYDIAISDEEDMRRFVTTAMNKSDFDSHVEIDCRKDHLVTLSTCAYNFDNARCIVIGRLVSAWKVPLEPETAQ